MLEGGPTAGEHFNTTSMPNELADARVGWWRWSGGESNAGA